jgi:hypothetical protein
MSSTPGNAQYPIKWQDWNEDQKKDKENGACGQNAKRR